jgi:hypothetical protein
LEGLQLGPTILTSTNLGSLVGVAIALTLLGLLVDLSIYAGLYSTVRRMLLKWLARRAIPVGCPGHIQSGPFHVRNCNNFLAICAQNRTMELEWFTCVSEQVNGTKKMNECRRTTR